MNHEQGKLIDDTAVNAVLDELESGIRGEAPARPAPFR